MNLKDSQTRINLMRSFAGESQARNRYTYAAEAAKSQSLHVIEAVFKFTANQEKEHGKIFYNFLKEMTGENITIDGSYPVDIYDDVLKLLRSAQHNEFEEFVKNLKKRSIKDFNVDISKDDNILTLSTCANNNKYRIVLHSVRVK